MLRHFDCCCCCCSCSYFIQFLNHTYSYTGVINEPPLPRRKKCPELAYRSHEFITGETRTKNDINARTYNGRARVCNQTNLKHSFHCFCVSFPFLFVCFFLFKLLFSTEFIIFSRRSHGLRFLHFDWSAYTLL